MPQLSRFLKDEIESGAVNAWKILKQAIPDGQCKAVALRMKVSADYVRRWRREPLSDEAPLATGQTSPLDRVFDLVDAVFLVNPAEAILIVEAVNAHFKLLTEAHGIEGFNGSSEQRALQSAELLDKAAEAVNSLNIEGVTNETLHHLVRLRGATERAIFRVTKDLNGEAVAHPVQVASGSSAQQKGESADL